MRRLLRYLLVLLVLASIGGAVAVAFVDLPAPREPVAEPAEIEGLRKEIERVQ